VRILLDNKAKLTSRLPDGRAAWHIAADGGHAEIVRMLLHANEVNKSAKQDREQEPEKEELDASMVVVQADNLSEVSSALEEAEVEDDILDIDTPEWDYQMTGLERSILFGHGKCMQLFLEYGANVRRPIVAKKNRPTHYYEKTTVHTPLSLCMACPDSTVGLSMAKFLLEQGATCTSIDGKLRTFLHVAVNMGNMVFVKLFLEKDPKAKSVLNKLDVDRQSPVAAACARSDSAMVELLLQHGALVRCPCLV
jgi:ankyrin repeat protein